MGYKLERPSLFTRGRVNSVTLCELGEEGKQEGMGVLGGGGGDTSLENVLVYLEKQVQQFSFSFLKRRGEQEHVGVRGTGALARG